MTDPPPGPKRFEGSVVISASQNTWPITRAICSVAANEVVVRRRAREWRFTREAPPLQVTHYWLLPFMWRTVVWLQAGQGAEPQRGFVPLRPGALLRALAVHEWPTIVRRVTWRPSTWSIGTRGPDDLARKRPG